jgi:hypothetical protein
MANLKVIVSRKLSSREIRGTLHYAVTQIASSDVIPSNECSDKDTSGIPTSCKPRLPPARSWFLRHHEIQLPIGLSLTQFHVNQLWFPSKMDDTRRNQLIKHRTIARGMLTRIQNLIEAGDRKIMRFRLGLINYQTFLTDDTAQNELELSDDT